MEGDLSYNQIKSEFIVEKVTEENYVEIPGPFVKIEVFDHQDQGEIVNYEDQEYQLKTIKFDPAINPSIIGTNVDKILVLSLKKLTKNEIHGYQDFIKGRWAKKCDKNDRNRKIGCKLCGKLLHHESIGNHVNSHFDIKSYTCNICFKKFTWRTNLNTHKSIHKDKDTTAASFPCSKCGKTFVMKSRLNKHLRTVHMNESSKFRCDQCEKSYKSQSSLTSHINTAHLGIIKRTICNVCNKPFLNITEHMMTHSDKSIRYPCDECDQTFTKPKGLKLHKLRAHSEINLVEILEEECKICTRMVKSSILDNHGKYHSGENPFLCTICFKSYRNNIQMYTHNLKYHYEKEKPRPFSCPKCPMTFKHKTNLETHEKFNRCQRKLPKRPRSETRKSYKCDICSKEFTNLQTLTDHKRRHDGEPIKCQFCDKKFTLRECLRNHLLRFHMDALKELSADGKKEIDEVILGL